MARLKQLAPRVGQLQRRVAGGSWSQPLRDRVSAWRAWYSTRRWRDLRWSVLVDAICLHGRSFRAVLERHGWAVSGANVKALAAVLDRMQGPVRRA